MFLAEVLKVPDQELFPRRESAGRLSEFIGKARNDEILIRPASISATVPWREMARRRAWIIYDQPKSGIHCIPPLYPLSRKMSQTQQIAAKAG